MRVIQSARNSRFLVRRCSYANCIERSRVSLAVWKSLRRPWKLPLTAFITFLRRRRPGTTVLVRGMVLFPSDRSRVALCATGVGGITQAEHPQDTMNLGLGDQRRLAEPALTTARLLGQD